MNYNKRYKKHLPSNRMIFLFKKINPCFIIIKNKKFNFGKPFIRWFQLNWYLDVDLKTIEFYDSVFTQSTNLFYANITDSYTATYINYGTNETTEAYRNVKNF